MVLSGALAQKPSNAGHSWVFLNWLLGFRRLGWEVLFLDSLTPEMSDGPIGQSENLAYLVSTMASFGMGDDWSLFDRSDGCLIAGLTRAEVLGRLRRADFVLNVSGYLVDEELLAAARRRVYLDIDPGFGQMWRERGLHDPFAGHDAFVTVAENIGRPDCGIPTCGLEWITTRQPVVLDLWPARTGDAMTYTSVGSWRGPFDPVEYHGKT